jgi:hypothetical protein
VWTAQQQQQQQQYMHWPERGDNNNSSSSSSGTIATATAPPLANTERTSLMNSSLTLELADNSILYEPTTPDHGDEKGMHSGY